MMKPHLAPRALLAALLAGTLAACGSVESDPDVDPDGGGDDDTAPSILSVSPANQEAAVAPDAVIVIEFSEAMDQASVEAAWISAELGSDVAFAWDGAGEVLTITPDELPVAEADGLDPSAVDPAIVSFGIGAAAIDLAGTPLEGALESSFSTVRRLRATVGHENLLTDSRTSSNSAPAGAGVMYAGDTNADLQVKAVMTFALPELPAGAALESAALEIEHTGVSGTPYDDFGPLGAVHVTFAALADAYAAAPLASLGEVSTDGADGARSLDVTARVADDLANREVRGGRSQYRFEFATGTDDSGTYDSAQFSKESLALRLTLLVD